MLSSDRGFFRAVSGRGNGGVSDTSSDAREKALKFASRILAWDAVTACDRRVAQRACKATVIDLLYRIGHTVHVGRWALALHEEALS
ncbi:hypothetical protein [Paraburkholderia sp. BCC1885]|uniref:hypothetical protein n=1 Tax=Paraburkholderia sp. BCC1885 TaxID=2562669 RepID=UPI0011827DDA|nr:hypothetical protein [Paraburkholderia sp. BCC1885]